MALTRVARPMVAPAALPRAVVDYGAKGDGVANDSGAVTAMAAALGYVRFERGNYRMTTVAVDVPVFFEEGAYLTVDAANTVTITHTITAPRQHIFRGSGNVVLSSDADSGENARQVHVSWFGVFPAAVSQGDQAPGIQRAVDAMGNGRESEILFDFGNYHLHSGPIILTRGCHIKGPGTRRCVMRLNADGFDVFRSGEVACKWSEIQFEVQAPLAHRTNGAYIRILHGECEVHDVQCYAASFGIVVAANNARIDNVVGTFGQAGGVGSSLVHIASGSGSRVSNVMAGTSSFAPECLVRVGGTGGGVVSGWQVENITHFAPGASVFVEAFAGNVTRGTVSNVVFNGSSGTPPDPSIKFATSGAHSLTDVMVSAVNIGSYATNGITLDQASSGTMEDISFDGVTVSGASGAGITFSRTAGTMQDIRVGDTVNVLERAVPFAYVGATSVPMVTISPMALPDAAPATCWTWTIADDAVRVIDLQRSVFSGIGLLSVSPTVGTVQHGVFVIRAAATPSVTAITTLSAGVASTTGVLAGTTGTDGKITLSAAEGKIYIENRLGSSQAVQFTLLSGV